MCDEADGRGVLKVHRCTARKLVPAVQSIRSNETCIPEAERIIDEIAVTRHRRQARKRIGNDEVHAFHAGDRVSLLRREFHLQSIVDGSPNGKEHLVRANVRVDPGESGPRIRRPAGRGSPEAAQKAVAGIQTIAGIVKDCRLCINRAVDRSGVGASLASMAFASATTLPMDWPQTCVAMFLPFIVVWSEPSGMAMPP